MVSGFSLRAEFSGKNISNRLNVKVKPEIWIQGHTSRCFLNQKGDSWKFETTFVGVYGSILCKPNLFDILQVTIYHNGERGEPLHDDVSSNPVGG